MASDGHKFVEVANLQSQIHFDELAGHKLSPHENSLVFALW